MDKHEHLQLITMIDASIRHTLQFTGGDDYEAFINDPNIQEAVLLNLETIRENVNGLPVAFRQRYPEMPWKNMSEARDTLSSSICWFKYGHQMGIILEELAAVHPAIRHIRQEMERPAAAITP